MYQKIYRVKGEDVNDFMIMQNAAYLKYASLLLSTFLHENGFTQKKLNASKLGFDFKNDHLEKFRTLIFTNKFKINLVFKSLDKTSQKMKIDFLFYNEKDELIVALERSLFWYNYQTLTQQLPPIKIQSYFLSSEFYKKAV